MTKSEEIFIILKRIPEQQKYIVRLAYREVLARYDPEKTGKSWERIRQLQESAQGVFDNLINRLKELCQTE